MKILSLLLIVTLISIPSHAADTWTGFRDVGNIYTYSEEDTLYVYLEGVTCPSTKNYFTIHPNHMNNAKQLISMVLAAKMAKTKINIQYDPDYNSTLCFFKGLMIEN